MTSGLVQSPGTRIDGAKRAQELPVRQNDRHRDITLQAVHPGRVVAAVIFVLRHVIDDDRPAAVANFVADGRLDVEFAAGQQPKSNLVANSTGYPTILSHARHRGESHPGRAADHFQNGGDSIDFGDRGNVGRHGGIELGSAGVAEFPADASKLCRSRGSFACFPRQREGENECKL
jgi:hypothetical protein